MAPEALDAFARERMASYMVPRFIELRERLDYTELGKIRRETLAMRVGSFWDARAAH